MKRLKICNLVKFILRGVSRLLLVKMMEITGQKHTNLLTKLEVTVWYWRDVRNLSQYPKEIANLKNHIQVRRSSLRFYQIKSYSRLEPAMQKWIAALLKPKSLYYEPFLDVTSKHCINPFNYSYSVFNLRACWINYVHTPIHTVSYKVESKETPWILGIFTRSAEQNLKESLSA